MRSGSPARPPVSAGRVWRQPRGPRRPSPACRSGAVDYFSTSKAAGRRRLENRHAWVRRHQSTRGGVLSRHLNIERRASAMAVPHGALEAAAAGEDGALLAQPLRDRLHQDRRRGQAASSATQHDGRQGRRAARAAGARSNCFRADGARQASAICSIEVAQDPAMLVWLDGRTEHASQSRRRTSAAR